MSKVELIEETLDVELPESGVVKVYDYNKITNKPKINGVELGENNSAEDFNITASQIKVDDAKEYYDGNTVESVLSEIGEKMEDGLGKIDDVVNKDGTSLVTNKIAQVTPQNIGAVAETDKGKATGIATLDEMAKILVSQLPDFLLGQVLYGGTVRGVENAVFATLSQNAKSRLNTTQNEIQLTNNSSYITGYSSNEGIYYIAQNDFVFANKEFIVGDWLISNGNSWQKIDNTDVVPLQIEKVEVVGTKIIFTLSDGSTKETELDYVDATLVSSEELSYNSLSDRPFFVVTNQKDFDELIVLDNVGKTISYNGDLYLIEAKIDNNAPKISVGDTIDKLYFNLNATVDCSLFDFGEDDNIQFMSYGADNVLEVYKAPAENSPTGKEEYYINNIFEGTETVIWASFAFAGLGWIEGWQQNIIDANGVFSIGETQTVNSAIQPNAWSSYISKEPFGASTGGGIIAKKVGGGVTSYPELTDKPIEIGDLDTLTPVANTYYKHNGASETTYTKGVIYFYDGSVFKPVTGGGGGGVSDVQIDGTSIVANGVANIPYATDAQAGLISTASQAIGGNKIFITHIGVRNGITNNPVYIKNTGSNASNPVVQFIPAAVNGTAQYFFYCNGKNLSSSNSRQAYFWVSLGSTTPYVVYAYHDGTNQYRTRIDLEMRNITGSMLIAPSTWSTGTSGSVTLPSAGLYEVKATLDSRAYTFIVNWDGTNQTCSMIALNFNGDKYYRFIIFADGTVGLQDIVIETGLKTNLGDTTISYRKIGIA